MHDEPQPVRTAWEPLAPVPVARPTYFPAGLAMGTAFVFWGLVTSWVVLLVGVGLFAVMLGGWIAEICHERNQH